MKTVALKNPNSGEFTMMQLTGFGSISADDRSQYTSHSTFTAYQATASDTFGTKVSLGNIQSSVSLHDTRLDDIEDTRATKVSLGNINANVILNDTRLDTLEDTSVGIVDGGRASLQYTEATDIDGGSASL